MQQKESNNNNKNTSKSAVIYLKGGLWYRGSPFHFVFKQSSGSRQIMFVYKQVICQAKDKFWPDKKPAWLEKEFFSC